MIVQSRQLFWAGMAVFVLLCCDKSTHTPTQNDTVFDQKPDTVGTPGNVRLVSVSASGITVAWDTVAAAKKYRVTLYDYSMTKIRYDTSLTNEKCISGIAVNIHYFVSVASIKDTAVSRESAPCISVPFFVYNSPDSVKAIVVSGTSAEVTWSRKQGESVKGYRAYLYDYNGGKLDSIDVDSSTTRAVFSGLILNSAYKVNVATRSDLGCGGIDTCFTIDTASSHYNSFHLPYCYLSTYSKPPALNNGKLVGINGGIFMMGATWDDSTNGFCRGSLPCHEVVLSSFYLSAYETTCSEYAEFLNGQDSITISGDVLQYRDKDLADTGKSTWYLTRKNGVFEAKAGYEQYPVIALHWYGAAQYCNWLSKKDGLEPCYTAAWECDFTKNGYRLPTEAEYEYASSGAFTGVKQRFPWGFDWTTTKACVGGTNGPKPVGTYSSYNGFYDLTGNAMEYVNDWSDEHQEAAVDTSTYYKACKALGVVVNPHGPAQQVNDYKHLMRGGSFETDKKGNVVFYRYCNPCIALTDYGFRTARNHQ